MLFAAVAVSVVWAPAYGPIGSQSRRTASGHVCSAVYGAHISPSAALKTTNAASESAPATTVRSNASVST